MNIPAYRITIADRIKAYRRKNSLSLRGFGRLLGVSAQAVSKWENKRTLPDTTLLPKIADFFQVTIDTLFKGIIQDENNLSNISDFLELNRKGWNGIASKNWGGTNLPDWGVYMVSEEKLHLLDDLTGKKVLEIACGDGQSLLYCSQKNAKELWGVDISEQQIAKARQRLQGEETDAKLFLSPMEVNPGIPELYEKQYKNRIIFH